MTRLGRGLRHRPVLLGAGACGVVVGITARAVGVTPQAALLVGWCAGIVAFLGPTLHIMARATPDRMRRRAELLDDGETVALVATLAAAIAALAALAALGWFLASRARPVVLPDVVLALVTLALSWGFVHVLFAVRYAHEYWQAGGGLQVPGCDRPGFTEFLYLALTIGMAFQTSDVAITGPAMRRLALVHALVAFLFNTVILAAAVNLAAGLVGTP